MIRKSKDQKLKLVNLNRVLQKYKKKSKANRTYNQSVNRT